jgi:tRNA threonylcarbamoyl adenosine modification protein YeaZ
VLVVGFDTATPAVSAALHDGTRIVGAALTVDARRQGELLAPMIAKVMADAGVDRADLTAVAVGVGPGPYTGLRVGLVTAKVFGDVLGIPVHGVCTLDIIAAEAVKAGHDEFLVATDARRKEVYWARYDSNGRRTEGPLVARTLCGIVASGGETIPAEPLYLRRPDAREPGAPKRVTPP